jgi:hypothetical protein
MTMGGAVVGGGKEGIMLLMLMLMLMLMQCAEQ